MCLSLRGGTYYGASLHITIGLVFLGGFFVDLLGIAEIWHNPYATYFSLSLAFLYICMFIVFGLLIFRGTEKESGKLLKGSIAGFVALQISAFFVYLIILAITNSIKKSRLAAAEAGVSSEVTPSEATDLNEIGAILDEASEELHRSNKSNGVMEDVLNAVSPTINPNILLLSNSEPIISIHQVIIIIIGGIITVAYTAVVVMYFREIETENVRSRPGSRY